MSTQTKKKSSVSPPLPINKVFVSSTFTDMLPYREAIRSAIDRANCKAVGMERFGAASIPSLEKCLEELKTCQIYVCAIGMRYGSIDKESQMSYTQLEFNYAKHIGMPILAFLIDGKKAVFHEGDFDTGDSAERLKEFKEEIKDSSITCDFFATAEELEVKVLQSLNNEISREEAAGSDNSKVKAHIDGAELFSRFIKLPAIYKNQEAVLQVRFDGKFGSYMLTDALPIAFGFQPGTALFLNNLFVLGKEPDVSIKEWYADCFAAHRAADWILDNEVTSFSRAIEFIGAVRIDKKLYRFSCLSLRLCCSDKRFHSLLDTVNRIFINWKPRFQPHLSAGRGITNPNTFSLHINHSCSYWLGAVASFLPSSYAQTNPNAKKCNADYVQYQHEQ